MKFDKAILALMITAATQWSTASAATLFLDDFDLDPASNGWTEFIDQGTDTTNASDIYQTGSSEVIFDTDYNGSTGADNEIYRLTRTLNATGFSNLVVKLWFRTPDTMEGGDNVKLRIDTGSGLTSVAIVNGANAPIPPIILGPTPLGAATDNATFDLAIESTNNAENIYLDRIHVYEQYGDVLYSEGFSLNAGDSGSTDRVGFTDGWTVEDESAANGFSANSNGSQVVLARTTVDSSPDSDDYIQLTHAFDTTGYGKINIEFDASQTNTFWESDDYLQILYTTDGTNYINVLKDNGVWNGNTNTSSGNGNTAGAVFGPFELTDPAIENNPNFGLRIVGRFNSDAEDYLLNNLIIRGFEIPTPAALPAGLALMTLLAGRRRRV